MARTRPPFAVEKPVFESLDNIARELRLKLFETAQRTRHALPAECLSVTDILVALYWQAVRIDPKYPDSPIRDRFVFNYEACVLAYYAALAKRGFFPLGELDHFDEPGSRLPLMPLPNCVPGVEWACGTTSHGLSVATGMALSAQVQAHNYNVYVLVGENSCQEGILWESAALAARLNLGNLIAVVAARTKPAEKSRGAAKTSLATKWQSQGWNVREVDGHDIGGLTEALQPKKNDDTPLAVIASTTKGKGFSAVESEGWLDRVPTAEDLDAARREIGS